MPKRVLRLLNVKIAHFLIDRKAIFFVFREVIPAIVAIAQNHAHAAQLPADFIRQIGLSDQLLKSLLREGFVEGKSGEGVAVFRAHQTVLDLELENGLVDLAVQATIPADTRLLPFAHATDVGVIILHIGRVKIKVVYMARRVG